MAADIINIATHGEVEELRESMKELSADITEGGDLMNERNELGKSAMDAAAMLGRAQMLQELQAHGADFNLSNNSGGYNLSLPLGPVPVVNSRNLLIWPLSTNLPRNMAGFPPKSLS